MSYFTPKELPENKYYIFGKDGAKNLADDLKVPFIGCIPLIQSVREAGDFGRPVAMQEETIISEELKKITQNIVSEVIKRNKDLPVSEAIKITTMAGCSAVNK
jgi:ATP-binding protein involved in chromosome partitioning